MEWDHPNHIVRFLGPLSTYLAYTRTCLQLIAVLPIILQLLYFTICSARMKEVLQTEQRD